MRNGTVRCWVGVFHPTQWQGRKASSGREDRHSRLAGADFSGIGCIGKEESKWRARVFLMVKLHKNLLSVIRKIEGLEIPPGKSSPLEFG